MTPSYDSSTLTEPPLDATYRVWSERKHRWVGLTFFEYQAWLARPDLDPAAFTSAVSGPLSGTSTLDVTGSTGVR